MREDRDACVAEIAARFTPAEFEARARKRLLPLSLAGIVLDDGSGDHVLDDVRSFLPDPANLRAAAVLVPIVGRETGATVLLTERAAGLATHSGQVAFPGGSIDADETPVAAALREAYEEVGLNPGLVSPIGALPPYLTGTGFSVAPIVALVDPRLTLTLNAIEVADAFEAPLAFLMDPANHDIQSRQWKERTRRYYVMPWEGRNIWGATAGMLRALYERVYA